MGSSTSAPAQATLRAVDDSLRSWERISKKNLPPRCSVGRGIPVPFLKGRRHFAYFFLEKEWASSLLISATGRSGCSAWAGMWSRLIRIYLSSCVLLWSRFPEKNWSGNVLIPATWDSILPWNRVSGSGNGKSCKICSSRVLNRMRLADETDFSLPSVAVHSLHSLGDWRWSGWSQPHGKQVNFYISFQHMLWVSNTSKLWFISFLFLCYRQHFSVNTWLNFEPINVQKLLCSELPFLIFKHRVRTPAIKRGVPLCKHISDSSITDKTWCFHHTTPAIPSIWRPLSGW